MSTDMLRRLTNRRFIIIIIPTNFNMSAPPRFALSRPTCFLFIVLLVNFPVGFVHAI